MMRVLIGPKPARALRTASRPREFREMAQTPAMRAVAARCSPPVRAKEKA